MRGTLRERVFSRLIIDQDAGCVLWNGARVKGYGMVQHEGKPVYVHRLMYEWFTGPIPDGMELDHLCRVKHCAAPAHLEAVPHAENIRRGETGRHNAVKTHCPQGHPYDEANAAINNRGSRYCRRCKRERDKESYERKKVTP
jgi:hypothetical protein